MCLYRPHYRRSKALDFYHESHDGHKHCFFKSAEIELLSSEVTVYQVKPLENRLQIQLAFSHIGHFLNCFGAVNALNSRDRTNLLVIESIFVLLLNIQQLLDGDLFDVAAVSEQILYLPEPGILRTNGPFLIKRSRVSLVL